MMMAIIGRVLYFMLGALVASLILTTANADGVAPKKPGKAPTLVLKEVVQEKDGTGYVYFVLSDGTRCLTTVEGLSCSFKSW